MTSTPPFSLSSSRGDRHPPLTAVERKIKRVGQDALRMGALVESSMRLSQRALFRRDLSVIPQITELEAKIDFFYRQIELDCVLALTLNAPVAEDCRWLSSLMQLVRDLERIGDYAQDLGEISVKLFPYPAHPCLPEIERMAQQAQAMLSTSLASLVEPNSEAGLQMKQQDDAVDEAYDRLYEILAKQRDVPGVVEPILLLVLAIRHIERMADHATNIAQRSSYIVTGERH
jgi:phosphate transport system protein